MAKLTKTEFARMHQINVTNIVWSWGGIQSDGSVVLFVWDDEIQRINGERCVQVLDPAFDARPGYSERFAHLEQAKLSGSAIKLAIQRRDKKDANEISKTKDIVSDLFHAGVPFEHEGTTWVPVGLRIKA